VKSKKVESGKMQTALFKRSMLRLYVGTNCLG